MTPQETQLVDDLFDRLAKLENAPRDAAAESLIAGGLRRAPHAVYALVQTALLQDEALKRANARIEELQAQGATAGSEEARPVSFLDTMREALTGHATARGSVPSVRSSPPGGQPPNPQSQAVQAQSFQQSDGQPPPGYQQSFPPGYPSGAPLGSGGSFLGTAASAAAGMIGGALLLNGIRSVFGHHSGGYAGEAFSPWSNEASTPSSDLARELGADQIGNEVYDAGTDQAADVDSIGNEDDGSGADDGYDGDDDFNGGNSGDDSYDV